MAAPERANLQHSSQQGQHSAASLCKGLWEPLVSSCAGLEPSGGSVVATRQPRAVLFCLKQTDLTLKLLR